MSTGAAMKLGDTIAAEKPYEESPIELHHKDNRGASKYKVLLSRYINTIKLVTSIILLGVVVGYLAFNFDLSEVRSDLHQLSFLTILVIFAALVANALAAALRLKTIAADIGHSVSFRKAMATVSAGSLAGALFFQIAGQLIARGVLMARVGIPFANVVVITAYERIIAAILSGLLGLAGAYYIFGVVYLDQSTGGAALIKLTCGLIAAIALGAWFGYGRLAARSVATLLTRDFTRRSLRIIALTLLVQMPIMVAYVVASKALSANTSIYNLVAASAIVMFAASIPISFAGWGVREMSAIAALGAIGVAGHAAFTAAILIGFGSLLAMGFIAILALPGSVNARSEVVASGSAPIDYSRALSWVFPLAAATLVLFQIYVPIGSGLLNVNLADPIALMGGALFILSAIKQGRMPKWRVPYVNAAVAVATLALAVSLLIGGSRFGWTTWAWVNRFLGWFVLLSYGATGALAVMENGRGALRTVLLTFVGATAAIAGIDVGLVLLHEVGIQFASLLIAPGPIEGFAQNRNSFALQLLMATPAMFIFVRGGFLRIGLFSLMLVAFWFAGSRSGWIAMAIVVGIGLHLRATTIREVVTAAICAASVTLAAAALYSLSHVGWLFEVPANSGAQPPLYFPNIVPTESSTHERIVTIVGGLKLFVEHPIFGAGLGAFRNQMILATSGLPLVIHSTPLWLLAELGIVGFLAFAIPAIYVFVTELCRARKDNDEASAVIVLSFVAFAVMSGPADMLYQRSFWLVVGAALALPPMILNKGSAHEFKSPRK
jgi:hypothetical protein